MASLNINQNVVGNTGILTGDYYAFTASGGLVLEQSFEEIAALTQDGSFSQVDVTDVIQILYDVRKANSKIGITKDASNELITATTFDEVNQTFSTDKLVITADEIIDDLSANGAGNIVSVGKCETLYTDFENYIHTYFGYFGGFASLFDGASTFDISGNFSKEALFNLMVADASNSNGAYINKMTGSIEVDNITELLRFAVDTNLFNNRDPSGEEYEDSDPSHNMPVANFGVGDGFVPGDLIYVPNGAEIKLNVDIAPETYSPINNLGPNQSALSTLAQEQTTLFSGNGFSSTTTATLHNIHRVVKSPLLLRLVNFGYQSSGAPTPANSLSLTTGINNLTWSSTSSTEIKLKHIVVTSGITSNDYIKITSNGNMYDYSANTSKWRLVSPSFNSNANNVRIDNEDLEITVGNNSTWSEFELKNDTASDYWS